MPLSAFAMAADGYSGEGDFSGGESLTIAVPQTPSDLAFRFVEVDIDLRVKWSLADTRHSANATGRRFGEQWVWLPASARPMTLQLESVLPDAAAGRVSWQFQSVGEGMPFPSDIIALESRAAEFADQDSASGNVAALADYQTVWGWHSKARSPRSAELVYRLGQVQMRLTQWVAAEMSFRIGLGDQPGDALRGRLQHVLGYVLSKQGRHDEALQAFSLALQLLEKTGDRYELALATNNRCLAFHAQGDMSAAAACFDKAEQAYASAGINGYRGTVLINMGAALATLGRLTEAEQAFERAHEQIERLPEPDAERLRVSLDLHRAWSALDSGRYAKALEFGLSAQTLGERSNRPGAWGQAIRATAAALIAMGQTDRARQQLNALLSSAPLVAAVSDPARLSYAAARLEPDPAVRELRMGEVMSAAMVARDDLTYLRAWMQQARAQRDTGQMESARIAAQGCLAMARQSQIAEVEIDALMLLSELMSPEQALVLQAKALQRAGDARRTEDRFDLLHASARQLQKLARWPEAREAILQAEAAYQLLRMELSSEEQAGLRSRLRPRVEGSLSAGVEDPNLNMAGRADWVWGRLQARRDWSSAAQHAAGSTDVADLRQFLVPAADRPLSDVARLRRLETIRFDLERTDRRRPQDEWVDWRTLQGTLSSGEVLLVLLADDPVSAVLMIEPDQVVVEAVAAGSELRMAIAHVLRGLGRQDPLGQEALRARISHLSSLLGQVPEGLSHAHRINYLPGPGTETLPLELLLEQRTSSVVRLTADTLAHGSEWTTPAQSKPKQTLILQASDQAAA
ncbi:MAG: tetratricopeptide repeat protein, partial [Xanthomonadales bacterium]|nr:tetratricopeptide repeat protein [Xanthomonadales bacterium]